MVLPSGEMSAPVMIAGGKRTTPDGAAAEDGARGEDQE